MQESFIWMGYQYKGNESDEYKLTGNKKRRNDIFIQHRDLRWSMGWTIRKATTVLHSITNEYLDSCWNVKEVKMTRIG